MDLWFVFILFSALAYRVTYFVIEDALIDEPRAWVRAHLGLIKIGSKKRWRKKLADKLLTLTACPWCVSVYVSAGIVAVYDGWFGDLPVPAFWVLALSCGALVFWSVIEE